MAYLAKSRIQDALRTGKIRIQAMSEPKFNRKEQVSESCIDLRIHGYAKRYSNVHATIDLKDLTSAKPADIAKVSADYFEEFKIPDDGCVLKPNETIFTTTHERIRLGSGLIGFVIGRANFAKLGIQVTCMAPKCPPGLDWHFPLQITNLSGHLIRIYPYSRMVQLMIATMVGSGGMYQGPQTDYSSDGGPGLSDSTKPILAKRDTRPKLSIKIADITEGARKKRSKKK